MYTRESFANVPYNFANKNKHLNLRYNLNFESKRMIFKKKNELHDSIFIYIWNLGGIKNWLM